MSKPSIPQPFSGAPARKEQAIDKTTRAANEIIGDQNAQRDRKTALLREARLKRAAKSTVDPKGSTSKGVRKAARTKPGIKT